MNLILQDTEAALDLSKVYQHWSQKGVQSLLRTLNFHPKMLFAAEWTPLPAMVTRDQAHCKYLNQYNKYTYKYLGLFLLQKYKYR